MNYSKVVTYFCGDDSAEMFANEQSDHESISQEYVARKISDLIAVQFDGAYSREKHFDTADLYFVPNDTMLLEHAEKLGIRHNQHLFGGCVPFPFVATKSISHALIAENAVAPPGWHPLFAQRTHDLTLRGFSAFSKSDALIAVERLLIEGPVRIKAPLGRGGNGQTVVGNIEEAEIAITPIDPVHCSTYGIVLETNLSNVVTHSVGTLTIGDTQISYCGEQFVTENACGELVYGGSSLRAIRGGFSKLLDLDWSVEQVLAIAQATIYDSAAHECFPGFFASRRNYDIGQGFDAANIFQSGVLEQSWRIGGASSAEIAAMEAFAREEKIFSVRTSCREVYAATELPENATAYVSGVHTPAGAITKYVCVDACEY